MCGVGVWNWLPKLLRKMLAQALARLIPAGIWLRSACMNSKHTFIFKKTKTWRTRWNVTLQQKHLEFPHKVSFVHLKLLHVKQQSSFHTCAGEFCRPTRIDQDYFAVCLNLYWSNYLRLLAFCSWIALSCMCEYSRRRRTSQTSGWREKSDNNTTTYLLTWQMKEPKSFCSCRCLPRE